MPSAGDTPTGIDRNDIDRDDIDRSLTGAIAFYQLGDYAEAASHFGAIVRRAPDHATALRLLGLTKVRGGATESGLMLLALARRLAPHEPLTHLHYGIGLQQAGQHARAAALFRRAAILLPDNPAPWANLATALLSLGHGKAARAAARRAVRLAPNAAECWHTLGLTQRAEGDSAASRDAFARALQANRRVPEIWVDHGLACKRCFARIQILGSSPRMTERGNSFSAQTIS